MSTSLERLDAVWTYRLKSYFELLKPRLSFLVVFSSGFGYLLANQPSLSWMEFIIFLLGGFLVSGSSVTINQVLERSYDSVMKRTQDRPIPSGRVSAYEAIWFSVFTGMLGLGLLGIFTNPLTVHL